MSRELELAASEHAFDGPAEREIHRLVFITGFRDCVTLFEEPAGLIKDLQRLRKR